MKVDIQTSTITKKKINLKETTVYTFHKITVNFQLKQETLNEQCKEETVDYINLQE